MEKRRRGRPRQRTPSEELYIENLGKQEEYLAYLKALRLRDLRVLHRRVFKETKWNHLVPRGLPTSIIRSWLTRRLFLYFAVRHYHWPKGHEIRKRFVRRAKAVLGGRYFDSEQTVDQEVAREMLDHSAFTKKAIKKLPELEVDRYLAMAGIVLDKSVPLGKKRKCLWEYYHLPRHKLPRVPRKEPDPDIPFKGRLMTPAPNGRTLKDYILRYNSLNYDKFMKRFGKYFPSTTRASFTVYRAKLRAEGHQMPQFARGVNGGNVIEEEKPKRKKAAKKKAAKKRSRTVTHTRTSKVAPASKKRAKKKASKKKRRAKK
jgi:hypothetical protein